MPRFRLLLPVFLVLWLATPWALQTQAQSPAAANKRLFDRAVDELNFRTMETVYDKSFTRRKFPVSLRTAKARKEFTDFAGRADLEKLFQNYNGVSERYKNRFGRGRTDLAEFEKQLRSILVDKNFEFFIRVLPRDERVSLIRGLERFIQQSAAQFNASEDAAPEELAADGAAVPPADVDAPIASATTAAPEETEPQTDTSLSSEPVSRSLDQPARHDWLDYLTLMLSGASTLLLLFLITSLLPDLRNRLDTLTDELDRQRGAAARPRSNALPEDRYDDEEDN
ncbi:hypothetical protein MTX78_08900 [Hymenobacter tibetensis]|uniref:DUF4129 domain-containing protein n=1 Tax=Hymenobacter tibetensis TaxID=497967 RepID=A0ABY4D3V3_9BACT|nr:hypothetical protein [Hymenobacter tibetensis]UOG76707.1 hypothetical protein MTX78_08900 [Hymenobacter tibetensis]